MAAGRSNTIYSEDGGCDLRCFTHTGSMVVENKNYRGVQNTQASNSSSGSNRDESKEDNDSTMDSENSMGDSTASKPTSPHGDL